MRILIIVALLFVSNNVFSQLLKENVVNLHLKGPVIRNKRVFSYHMSDNLKFTMSSGVNRVNLNSIDFLTLTRFDMRLKYYLPNNNGLVFRFQSPNLRRSRFISVGYVKRF
jgi:hypothetical protein